MNDSSKSPTVPFNPPLRIFSNIVVDASLANDRRFKPFGRPKLQRFVNHDRVAQYFGKRGLSYGSPLD